MRAQTRKKERVKYKEGTFERCHEEKSQYALLIDWTDVHIGNGIEQSGNLENGGIHGYQYAWKQHWVRSNILVFPSRAWATTWENM